MRKLALISFKTFSARGAEKLAMALASVSRFVEIEKVSSVYRVDRMAESFMSLALVDGEETLEGFVVVIQARTDLGIMDLARALGDLESQFKDQITRRVMSVNLLAVEGESRKTPMLTLPHPEFHLRPEELIPACELWPNYEHPILRKTIQEVAQGLPDDPWGEFYCQGNKLIDTTDKRGTPL